MTNRIKHPDWISPSDSPLEASQDFFTVAVKRHRKNLFKGVMLYLGLMILTGITSISMTVFCFWLCVQVLRWMGVL